MVGLPTALLGVALVTLGVLAFAFLVAEGLVVVDSLLPVLPGLLTEYGPAVAGLGAISGLLNLAGRIGATERPP